MTPTLHGQQVYPQVRLGLNLIIHLFIPLHARTSSPIQVRYRLSSTPTHPSMGIHDAHCVWTSGPTPGASSAQPYHLSHPLQAWASTTPTLHGRQV